MATSPATDHHYYDVRRQLELISAKSAKSGALKTGFLNSRPSLQLKENHWMNKNYVHHADKTDKDLGKRTVIITTDLPEIGIPGVRNILNARYSIWGKLIWAAVIIACTAICVYQVADRLNYYLSYPLTAEVTNFINQSLTFPLVSLCPYNPFQRDELVINLKANLSIKHGTNFTSMDELWEHMPKDDTYDLNTLWAMTTIHKRTIKVSQRCGFGRKADECNFKFEIKNMFSTFFGNCWTIGKTDNDDPIVYQGPMTGMTISIDEINSYNFSQIAQYTSGDPDEQSIGYSIYIHDHDTSPKYDAFYRGFTVYHSVNTIVSLSTKKFLFLNTTEYPCSVSKIVSDCWDQCIEQRILDKVTCRLPFLNASIPLCNGTENYNASYLAPRYIYLEATPENCQCPRRCEKIIYTPNTYTVKDDNFHHRTMIMIFFQDNMYEQITETEAFPIVAFFSDIGGTLGLFLGVCILTLGEMLEILIMLFKHSVRHGRCIWNFQEE